MNEYSELDSDFVGSHDSVSTTSEDINDYDEDISEDTIADVIQSSDYSADAEIESIDVFDEIPEDTGKAQIGLDNVQESIVLTSSEIEEYIEDISKIEQLQTLRDAIESGQISLQDVDHTEDDQKVLSLFS